ncbi:MAG: ParB/RepB/Spo0J family partition protein [Acidimicrobiales bacterium]
MTTTHDTSTVSTQEGYELREVDPRTIRDNPDNARKPKANREALAASIRSLGVLQPPLVREELDGTLVLVAGERRKYSAIAAGLATIPVHVRHGMSAVHQVAGMLVENHDREDLTPVEFASGLQQLAGMEGVTTKAITEMTGVKAAEVKRAVKVASSEVASAVAERHGLTLEQAVVLAEFEDDKGAVILLTQTALKTPERWPHVVRQLRQDRDDARAVAALTAELEAAGTTVVELRNGYWLPEGAVWLDELTPPEGRKVVTEAQHRGCPGHAAAVVDGDEGYEAAYLCLDAQGNGHTSESRVLGTTGSAKSESGGMTDEQKAERRAVIANNKAWPLAVEVRREFVGTLLARKSAPKGMLRYVTEAILSDPAVPNLGDDQALAALVGQESDGPSWDHQVGRALAAQAGDARLPLVLFAQVASAIEASNQDKGAWRRPGESLALYLGYLAGCGYGLSDVEQLVVTTVAGRAAEDREDAE